MQKRHPVFTLSSSSLIINSKKGKLLRRSRRRRRRWQRRAALLNHVGLACSIIKREGGREREREGGRGDHRMNFEEGSLTSYSSFFGAVHFAVSPLWSAIVSRTLAVVVEWTGGDSTAIEGSKSKTVCLIE